MLKFKKYILVILFFLIAIQYSINATQTQYKSYSAKNDYISGKFDGVALGFDGKLRVWNKTVEAVNSNLNKELWDILLINDKTLYYSAGAPAAIFEFEKEKDAYVFKNVKKLANTVIAPSKLLFDKEEKKLLYATIPDGKIYIYPDKELCKLPVSYIYDLIKINNYYYAATGPGGRIYKIDAKTGEYSVFYRLKDKEALTLARYKNFLLAGGSNSGLLYMLSLSDTDNKSRILENFGNAEIKKIIVNVNNEIYAAVNIISAGVGRQPRDDKQQPAIIQESQESFELLTENMLNELGAAMNQIIKPPAKAAAPPMPRGRQYSSGEIYLISEQLKTAVVQLPNESINDFIIAGNNNIYIAGNQSNFVYEINGKKYSIVHKTRGGAPQKLVLNDRNNFELFGASAPAAFYQIDYKFQSAEYLSDIIDLNYKSIIGKPEMETAGNIEIQLRGGNTSAPDNLWTEWTDNPTTLSARYLQYRLNFKSQNAELSKLNLAYKQFNVAPVLKSIDIQSKRKPNFPRNDARAQRNQNQMPPADAQSTQNQSDAPITEYTVSWNAEDMNNDRLIYSIFYSYETSDWIKIQFDKFYTQNTYNWNTEFFPDGKYRFKIVASDELDNSDAPLADEIISDYVTIDNTPPEITIIADAKSIVVNVVDKINIIKNCEYSVNGQDWRKLEPLDKIFDSTAETFILPITGIKGAVTFKTADADNNFAVKSVIIK